MMHAIDLTEPHVLALEPASCAQAAQLYEAAGSYDQAASLRLGSGGHTCRVDVDVGVPERTFASLRIV